MNDAQLEVTTPSTGRLPRSFCEIYVINVWNGFGLQTRKLGEWTTSRSGVPDGLMLTK